MSEARPDPDQLLASLTAEEARAERGKLRIFFGASAGVGKTYSMLEAARGMRATGVDIVIGYVEPHGRPETERLLEGMEQLPTLPVRYRGIVRQEFDLDAGLKRRPAILVVDELAHSNLIEGDPPPRHAKRWQDIEELLGQGINVWTTVNVQHLESLNDLVAQITGVRQRETIPDRIFDEADEIELIDLPPDDLLARLEAGKVYVPEQVAAAVERFFRKSNLIALRELCAAAHGRSRRRGRARSRARGPDLARMDGARPRTRGDRPGHTGGAGRARGQAHRRWTRRAVVGGLRRDAGAVASVDCRAQSTHRPAAAGGIARRGNGHARRTLGRAGSAAICAHAQRHAAGDRRAKKTRLARVAAVLDDARSGSQGARFRCDHDRRRR